MPWRVSPFRCQGLSVLRGQNAGAGDLTPENSSTSKLTRLLESEILRRTDGSEEVHGGTDHSGAE